MKILLDLKFYDANLDIERFVIYEKDDNYYYISSLSDKYDDVIKMPYYIKEDWMKYSSNVLTLNVLNNTIMKFLKGPSETQTGFTSEQQDIILQLKRDLKLKNIL